MTIAPTSSCGGAGATEVRVVFGGEAAGTLGGRFAEPSGLLIPSDRVVDATVTLPDVNGDGLAELVVRYAMPVPSAGAYLFFGEPGWRGTRMLADASVRVALGEWTSDPIGIEDLNGDGYAVLGIVVTEGDPLDGINVLYIYFGRSSWPSELTVADADVRITPFFTEGGEEVFVLSARVVQGDLDGDGLGDAGAGTGPWVAYLYLGRTMWPADLPLADADVEIAPGGAGSDIPRFPDLTMQGDIDGDGLGDLLLRLPIEREGSVDNAGRVAIYRGRSAWPSTLGADDADVVFVGDTRGQQLGGSLAVADVDGDGCDDLVTGSITHPADTQEGQVFVHFGQPIGPR